MSDPNVKPAGSGHTDSLVRGGIGFFSGLLFCLAALLAQAALLHAIAERNQAK